jgi:hypothetical protein
VATRYNFGRRLCSRALHHELRRGPPCNIKRLRLRSFESYSMDFTHVVSDIGRSMTRAPGTDVIVGAANIRDERIVFASPDTATNNGIRASWRTSKDLPRVDISVVFENARTRRLLDAQMQRSSIMLGFIAPVLLSSIALTTRRAFKIRPSRSRKSKTRSKKDESLRLQY